MDERETGDSLLYKQPERWFRKNSSEIGPGKGVDFRLIKRHTRACWPSQGGCVLSKGKEKGGSIYQASNLTHVNERPSRYLAVAGNHLDRPSQPRVHG